MRAEVPIKTLSLFLICALQLAFTSACISQEQLASEVKLGLSFILKFNGVAKDLKLTDEQNESLMGLWVEIETGLENAFREYEANYSPRLSAEELDALKNELAAKIDNIRKTEMERLGETLSDGQLSRLKQIRFQILKRNSDGLQALVSELSLTGEQLGQINKIKSSLESALQGFLYHARVEQLTQNEIEDEVRAIRGQHEKELLEILTEEQRANLKELEGDLYQEQRGPPTQTDK